MTSKLAILIIDRSLFSKLRSLNLTYWQQNKIESSETRQIYRSMLVIRLNERMISLSWFAVGYSHRHVCMLQNRTSYWCRSKRILNSIYNTISWLFSSCHS